jgi:hypothetical protein
MARIVVGTEQPGHRAASMTSIERARVSHRGTADELLERVVAEHARTLRRRGSHSRLRFAGGAEPSGQVAQH